MAGELILIVEDNEKNLKLARDILHFHGYRTLEATTSEEGIELARTRKPSLILMDIQLPGMDGFAAFRLLRQIPETHRTPVIAVTASAMAQDRERILAAGFDGYHTKPISIKELPQLVRRVIDAAPVRTGPQEEPTREDVP
jgi:two-component system cell cycle response regulator DivK